MAKRPKSQEIKVFADASRRQFLSWTTMENALANEARGLWRRVYCSVTGRLLGMCLDGAEVNRVDADLPHSFTSVAISRTEMEINASGIRASHTFRMTEPDRLACIKNGQPPEDAVERTIAKVRVYKRITSARGDILRVWPK